MNTYQQTYYEVLDVERTASQADIKRAFRTLAKKYHPDTNPGGPRAAAKRFQEVMTAYRILGNERERARYDVLLQSSPSFREASEAAGSACVATQAQSILDDLLRADGRQALATYDELSSRDGFSLRSFMATKDYMDCVFLVAEQMERVGRNREATCLYEELYAEEKNPPRVRYFFDTVKSRLKKLYSRKLPREARTAEEEIASYERILEFDVDRSEKAFILKKIAEVYLRIGEDDKARGIFNEALELKPGLKGTATIRERLGLDVT